MEFTANSVQSFQLVLDVVALFVLSYMAKWFSGIALAFMGRFKDLSSPS